MALDPRFFANYTSRAPAFGSGAAMLMQGLAGMGQGLSNVAASVTRQRDEDFRQKKLAQEAALAKLASDAATERVKISALDAQDKAASIRMGDEARAEEAARRKYGLGLPARFAQAIANGDLMGAEVVRNEARAQGFDISKVVSQESAPPMAAAEHTPASPMVVGGPGPGMLLPIRGASQPLPVGDVGPGVMETRMPGGLPFVTSPPPDQESEDVVAKAVQPEFDFQVVDTRTGESVGIDTTAFAEVQDASDKAFGDLISKMGYDPSDKRVFEIARAATREFPGEPGKRLDHFLKLAATLGMPIDREKRLKAQRERAAIVAAKNAKVAEGMVSGGVDQIVTPQTVRDWKRTGDMAVQGILKDYAVSRFSKDRHSLENAKRLLASDNITPENYLAHMGVIYDLAKSNEGEGAKLTDKDFKVNSGLNDALEETWQQLTGQGGNTTLTRGQVDRLRVAIDLKLQNMKENRKRALLQIGQRYTSALEDGERDGISAAAHSALLAGEIKALDIDAPREMRTEYSAPYKKDITKIYKRDTKRGAKKPDETKKAPSGAQPGPSKVNEGVEDFL